jgi:phosphoserine aminotransferase
MNVCFKSISPEIDEEFIKQAKAKGFDNLKGHRTTGGMRASIYNAMPINGVKALVSFMREFEQNLKV